MAVKTAIPYLILNGQAERALEQYKSVLGGEVTTLQRFGEVDQSCPEANRNLIMHAELRVDDALLMLSDGPGHAPVPTEGAVQVALGLDGETTLRRVFDALSAGGRVVCPPINAPWGGVFCSFADRYGVGWMLTSPVEN